MQPANFEEGLEQILNKDNRYHRDAYLFIREALDFTQKQIAKKRTDQYRHISGKELLAGIREFGLQQFGPMTRTVLEDWGVRVCEDFGEIVFNMVEAHLLAKTDQDTRADFQDGYDFVEAFKKPFLPTATSQAHPPESTQA